LGGSTDERLDKERKEPGIVIDLRVTDRCGLEGSTSKKVNYGELFAGGTESGFNLGVVFALILDTVFLKGRKGGRATCCPP